MNFSLLFMCVFLPDLVSLQWSDKFQLCWVGITPQEIWRKRYLIYTNCILACVLLLRSKYQWQISIDVSHRFLVVWRNVDSVGLEVSEAVTRKLVKHYSTSIYLLFFHVTPYQLFLKTNLHHTFVWLNLVPANNRSFWPSAIFNFHLSILFSALVRIWNTGVPMQPVCWTRARYQWTDCWVCLHPFQSRVSYFWQGTYIQRRTFL